MSGSFLKIFAELEAAVAAGVLTRYAVGGAIAATFYLEPTSTEDVDVFVVVEEGASTLHPFGTVYEWFRGRGAAWRDEAVDGQVVRVLSLEHLAAIALETGRSKDRVRLLQMWQSDLLDRSRFLELVERFGLGERWQRFLSLIEGAS